MRARASSANDSRSSTPVTLHPNATREERGPRLAAVDVQETSSRLESHVFAEQADPFDARWVLDVVIALGDLVRQFIYVRSRRSIE